MRSVLNVARLARRASSLLAVGALLLPVGLSGQEEEHAAEAGGAALFNPNLGLSLWTVVIFLALLGILWKYAWGPILASATTREERIQKSLDEAAARQAEAAALLEQHRAQLADARRQVQEMVAEGKTAGERLRKDIEEKARADAQSTIERARREIQREKDAAVDELRRESVELALAAAGKLLERKLDAKADRDLVLGYIGDLTREQSAGGKA
jgi:F-type H+-transporting ATPase subunit b